MSYTTEVIMKFEEGGANVLNHSELVFVGIIKVHLVCSNCHNDIEAIDANKERICPICSGKEFHKVEVDYREYKCPYCKRYAYPYFYETWSKLPFINTEHKTFYCGCRGWD